MTEREHVVRLAHQQGNVQGLLAYVKYDGELRLLAASALGHACHRNPDLQDSAAEAGAVRALLRLLDSGSSTAEVTQLSWALGA
jgi:hypothetical protein